METISWVAPEHEHREHTSDWYWAIGIISVSLAIAFIIAGNMLLSIVIVLGMGTLLFTAKNPPQLKEYKISRIGIRAGSKLYPWESLHSFCVVEKEEDSKDYHEPKLMLISKKSYLPHIMIPLNEYIKDDVYEALVLLLPEEPREEPIIERLARKAGF